MQVVSELGGDPISATRMASAVSEMCRRTAPINNSEARLLFELEWSGLQATLRLTFESTEPSDLEFLRGFFDDVVRTRSGAESAKLHASQPFSVPVQPSTELLGRLRATVNAKGREELLVDLRASNEELRASLEDLRRARTAKERMETELQVGCEIQMSMLPVDFAAYAHRTEFDIWAALEPAREVGGDFYDFFLIDETHLCFCVGDVSGKGVPAALFMAVTKTLIKSNSLLDASPARTLERTNDALCENNPSSMFVTVFVALLDLSTGELRFTNAGHNPPYVKRRSGALLPLSERHGPVIGAISDLTYGEASLQMDPGDLVLLYTDGVTEATDHEQSLFSDQRLIDFLETTNFADEESAVRETMEEVWRHQGDSEQADDVTVLALTYHGSGRQGR